MNRLKAPLYRKENNTAHTVHPKLGGAYRDERNTKEQARSEAARQSIRGPERRGLNYTPLFKFLLSKVGQRWDDVHAEAVKRLDRPDPIFWLVARYEHERQPVVRAGESSLYSGMYVDAAGLLELVDPSLSAASFAPDCKCCTHTFNGVRFTKPFTDLC